MDGWPITLEQAAERLKVKNIRRLREHARKVKIGRKIGAVVLFDREEFDALYRSLPCHSESSNGAGKTRKGQSASPSTCAALSAASVSTRLAAHLTAAKQKRSGRSGRRNFLKHPSSGLVLSFPSNERR